MSSAPAAHSHPTRIGPYRVIARIAAGGMAEIYLAKRSGVAGFERAVVIKRMLPHLAHEPELRTTLLDEARLMSRLRHPNIVNVHEFSRDARDFYLVMEFLRGESLSGLRRELLGRNERLDPALATFVVAEMCAGLHAAHEACDDSGQPLEVVHRDVSPQNVFVTFDGEVKLLDFGIACFADRGARTKTGMTKGKFAYMSPEHFAGERLDRRADVFAAGAMLHELLTGKRLFARESEAQVLKAVLHDPIPLPSQLADDDVLIPEALDEICMRALARERDQRYASAEELRTSLRDLMPHLDPRQRARERLVELTRRVLPHRFEETQALMRRAARASGESGDFEALAPFEDPPNVPTLSGAVELDVLVEGDRSTAAERPSRRQPAWLLRRGPLLVGAGALALVTAVAVAVLPSSSAGSADDPTRPLPAPSAAERAGAPVSLAPTAAAPAEPARAPATVRVQLQSTPARASVTIDGELRGTTPLDLELPRGDTPVRVRIERAGYVSSDHAIVPQIDQRIVVRLEARRARPRVEFTPFD